MKDAACITIKTVKDFYQEHQNSFDYVRFVLFDEYTFQVYKEDIKKLNI